MTPLSRSVEDYRKAIYALSKSGAAAATSAIARTLDVQPASVTGMVKRLSEAGFLEHEPYRGVRLTENGRLEALKILRRHRILETYLSERLGYSWDDVHDEAERLEHAASGQLIERMARALENPSHDPHGSPIPTPTGEVEAFEFLTLAEAPLDVRVQIREVRDDDSGRLRDMERRGLVPGSVLVVDGRERLDGPVHVRSDDEAGTPLVVDPEIARRIYVAEL